MSNRTDALQKHTGNMLALIDHIHAAIERQRESEAVKKDRAANEVLIEIERTLDAHRQRLEPLAQSYEAGIEATIKKAVSDALGVVAGLYDKVRPETVSRMLRDDYTALNMAVVSYSLLHTFGLAVREGQVAEVAAKSMAELTPLIVRLGRTIPVVVAGELTRDADLETDQTASTATIELVNRVWSHEHTEA